MKSKKGQAPVLQAFLGLIVIFVIVGITLAIGGRVAGGVKSSVTETQDYRVNNQSYNATPTPGLDLGYDNIVASTLNITNRTDGVQIPSSNYTLTASTGVIVWQNSCCFANQTVNATFDFTSTVNTSAYNATVQTESGISDMADFMPTIAIVIIASIVLGVIGFLLWRRS